MNKNNINMDFMGMLKHLHVGAIISIFDHFWSETDNPAPLSVKDAKFDLQNGIRFAPNGTNVGLLSF